jgi:hypothetical protein
MTVCVSCACVQEGAEGSERARLSSAGEDEWMIEGVTPDMGTHRLSLIHAPHCCFFLLACTFHCMFCIASLTLCVVWPLAHPRPSLASVHSHNLHRAAHSLCVCGVTDSSDPSERQGTPLRLRQHPPSLLSRGSSNSLSDMPNGAYARPRRNGPPRRTSLAELVADAVAEGVRTSASQPENERDTDTCIYNI